MCVKFLRSAPLQCLRAMTLASLWILAAPTALAGNNFPGTTISGSSGSITGTTVGASGESNENTSYPAGGALNSMWYSWSAPSTGLVTVNTCNVTGDAVTAYDSTLRVYVGTVFPLPTFVAGNDDATNCNVTGANNRASSVSFNATAATIYRFQVDGFGGNTGAFKLRWGYVGLVITPLDPSATEGGDTATFAVSLASPPGTTPPTNQAQNSVSPLTVPNVVVTIGTDPQCSFSTSSLTFNQSDWSIAQTVTVTAINDTDVEDTHACSISSITAAGGAYANVAATPPAITIVDNDTTSLSLTKSWNFVAPGYDANGNGTADAGDIVKYTFTVVNTGTVPVANVVISETAFTGTNGIPAAGNEQVTNDVAPAQRLHRRNSRQRELVLARSRRHDQLHRDVCRQSGRCG